MSLAIANAGKRPLLLERSVPLGDASAGKSGDGKVAASPQVLEGELIVAAAAETPPILIATSFDSVPVYSRAAAIRYYTCMQSIAARSHALCDVTV